MKMTKEEFNKKYEFLINDDGYAEYGCPYNGKKISFSCNQYNELMIYFCNYWDDGMYITKNKAIEYKEYLEDYVSNVDSWEKDGQ